MVQANGLTSADSATFKPEHAAPATSPKSTFEKKVMIADLVIKAAGVILLLVSGWIAVAKLFDDRKASLRQAADELEQRKKEFKIRFYEHQMALYSAICDAAAKVATAERFDDVKEELRMFNALYWGKLCIVESPAVERVQKKIHDELLKVKTADIRPSKQLQVLCYELAHACRDDLTGVFEPKIGTLPQQRQGAHMSADLLKTDSLERGPKVRGLR